MNSEIVYQVAKALPKEELVLLFEKLKKDFITIEKSNRKNNSKLTKEEAKEYLLSHVFNKEGKNGK